MSSQSVFLRIVQVANRFNLKVPPPGPGDPWGLKVDTTNWTKNTCCREKLLCKPFYIEDQCVGYMNGDLVEHLTLNHYPETFRVKYFPGTGTGPDAVVSEIRLNPAFKTYKERSANLAKALKDMRDKDLFTTLKGWRNENCCVWWRFSEPPLMEMERSAACLLGIKQYGVHINGYVNHSSKGLSMWIARRSKTNTFPGKLDQMVAGDLASGQTIMQCARKQCKEEASVPDQLIAKLKPAGSVSYFYKDERGLFPECTFVMDLEVPEDFQPVNADGEAESFDLIPIDKVKQLLLADEFKYNCALTVLDFLIRHGEISPENEPNYTYIVEQMHVPLLG